MRPRISIITVAVADLRRSFEFYRERLGLEADDLPPDADHAAFHLEGGLAFVLLTHESMASYIEGGEFRPGSPQLILSYGASSREEVDRLLAAAASGGGRVVEIASDQGWGYTGIFSDPDGHLWEVLWQPPSAVAV
jgi:hypothetical protein